MNDVQATAPRRYALSFTTGALLAREADLLVPLYLGRRDWGQTREQAEQENLLQARTQESRRRLTREAVQRLSALDDSEIEFLTEATSSERASLMWIAACRRFEFIGEFAEEVVRERFLLLTPTLGYGEFDSFVHGKALWHEELAKLSESTLQRLRSTVFRMLRDAEILSKSGEILSAVLSERVTAMLSARTPSDLRFFPLPVSATVERPR